MTGRHETDEPTTPDLHQQWAQQGLDGALEEISDLVGAYVTIADHGAPSPAEGGSS
ncbi:hypothetical protein OG894_44525 (plasmid) [Streptomyces sp. NBC_01724]|uniref:hypothetical protein n=1 Tax=Streptomyces sp. NBC_01724 TaxID=2975922 RepID=UPI002E3022F9|nr:hypothetical protein [Streptomyces sp. NBC_01724]